jgi:hypothetical protein
VPLLAKTTGQRQEVAGFEVSTTLPPRRGYIFAWLVDEAVGGTPQRARTAVADALGDLTAGGWVVYYLGCAPPQTTTASADTTTETPSTTGTPATTGVGLEPVEDAWRFTGYAYLIADGVSYFTAILGSANEPDGRWSVSMRMFAPNSHEPTADLFADRPPAVALDASCLQVSALPTTTTQQGIATAVGSNGPDPTRARSMPAGYR